MMENTPADAPKNNLAELFAAPEGQEHLEELVDQSDPMSKLSPEERDLLRLRNMKVDEIVYEYLGTRDNLDNARHEWQKTEKDLKDRIERMGMVLREKADAIGVDAFPIRGVATAYRNTKVSYRLVDSTAFFKWLDETKNFQCVEKRVAKLATAEVERVTGSKPPGVEKIEEVEFLVRRNQG